MRRSLVVDDSSVVRKVARRILEELDFSVVEAEDGRQALDRCYDDMPDFILVDWNMPVVGGVEFLTTLRSTRGGGTPKVVFCTSEHDVAQIARAMRAGADDFLRPPFNRATVEAKLHEVGQM